MHPLLYICMSKNGQIMRSFAANPSTTNFCYRKCAFDMHLYANRIIIIFCYISVRSTRASNMAFAALLHFLLYQSWSGYSHVRNTR